ncbi:LrgB family protein [Bacillus methanolicus]|uniref:LrgB family protein n=1 Tax=Bacillus methanolicus TaxID=1471 RepID=UPI002380B506|nr:LrgB family protein [Bacillus methanolicus]MDE3838915.1 LrgB family protein [Bacillus methanolicus]
MLKHFSKGKKGFKLNIVVTLYSIFLTIGVYLLTRKVAMKYPSPFTTPVFLSTFIIIIVLVVSNISYKEYGTAKEILTYLLNPATIALAVPLYKHRRILFRYFLPALAGLFVGTASTIISALFLAKLFKLTSMAASISIKSITIAFATEVSKIIGADGILVAAFVMITGMIGAMFGPWLLNKLHVTHPMARGLSIGTVAHGIGTAEIAREGELQGAVAGVAMGLAGILTSVLIPFLLP